MVCGGAAHGVSEIAVGDAMYGTTVRMCCSLLRREGAADDVLAHVVLLREVEERARILFARFGPRRRGTESSVRPAMVESPIFTTARFSTANDLRDLTRTAASMAALEELLSHPKALCPHSVQRWRRWRPR